MSDLFESVENLVVKVIADTGGFVRNEHYNEPDSRVVTRDIILKVAEKMEAEGMGREAFTFGSHFLTATSWLRFQVQGEDA